MMPDNTLRRSTLLSLAVGAFATYGLVAWLFGGEVVNEAINILLFSFAAGTAVAYWPDFVKALRKPLLEAHDVLAVGIFLAWSAVTISTVVAFIWRLFDKPAGWPDHWLWSLRICFSILGATCHLLAPHAIGGTVPARNWVMLGGLVTGALIFTAALLVFTAG